MGRNHTFQHEVQKDIDLDFFKYIYIYRAVFPGTITSFNLALLQLLWGEIVLLFAIKGFLKLYILAIICSLINFFRFFLCSSSFSRIYFIHLGCKYAKHQCLIAATPWPHLTVFSFFPVFFRSARTSYRAFRCRKIFPAPSPSSPPPLWGRQKLLSGFFPLIRGGGVTPISAKGFWAKWISGKGVVHP